MTLTDRLRLVDARRLPRVGSLDDVDEHKPWKRKEEREDGDGGSEREGWEMTRQGYTKVARAREMNRERVCPRPVKGDDLYNIAGR